MITNSVRLYFSTKDMKSFIQNRDTTKDTKKPMNKKTIVWILKFITASLNPNVVAANKVGIDMRKLNFAESFLEKPKNLAQVMVIPDLLVPGISANDCDNPI